MNIEGVGAPCDVRKLLMRRAKTLPVRRSLVGANNLRICEREPAEIRRSTWTVDSPAWILSFRLLDARHIWHWASGSGRCWDRVRREWKHWRLLDSWRRSRNRKHRRCGRCARRLVERKHDMRFGRHLNQCRPQCWLWFWWDCGYLRWKWNSWASRRRSRYNDWRWRWSGRLRRQVLHRCKEIRQFRAMHMQMKTVQQGEGDKPMGSRR